MCNKLSKDENKLNKQLDEYDKKFDEIDKQLKEKKDTKNAILKEIASLETILAGKIVCPKCGHEFSLQSKEPLDKVQEKSTTRNKNVLVLTLTFPQSRKTKVR